MINSRNDSIIFNSKEYLDQIKKYNEESKFSKEEQLNYLTENRRDQKELDQLNKNKIIGGSGTGDIEALDLLLTACTGGIYAIGKAIAGMIRNIDDIIDDYKINSLKKEMLEEKIAERKEMAGLLGDLKKLDALSKKPENIEGYQELYKEVRQAITESNYLDSDKKESFIKDIDKHSQNTEARCATHYEKKLHEAYDNKDSKEVKKCVAKLSHVEGEISTDSQELYSKIKEKIVDDKGKIKMHSSTGLREDLNDSQSAISQIKVKSASGIGSSHLQGQEEGKGQGQGK